MTFRLGVGALILAAAGSCLPHSLDDLEKDGRSSCDASHPCVGGWHCGVDGFCAKDVAGGMCDEGAKMSCGVSVGECETGTQTCSGGMWGACIGGIGPVTEVCDGKDNDCNNATDDNAVDAPLCPLRVGVCLGKHAACGDGGMTTCAAAVYGADYELTESRCDGKDNDCDNMTDEGLNQLCPEQRGECAGASVNCTSGSFPACNPAVYTANDVDFEAYETKCDGKDNDCDGNVDTWTPSNVSGSTLRSRNPAAGVSSLAPNDVVLIWEEEEPGATRGIFKVKTRVVRLDDTKTAIVSPSTTATAAYKSWAPAIATDGPAMVAAWAEEVTNGGIKRIALAALDPSTGQSTLMQGMVMMGALAPLSSGAAEISTPNEIAVALDTSADRVFVVVVDGTSLTYTALPAALSTFPATVYKKINVASGVSHVRAAPAGGRNFWLSYDTASGAQRCLVDDSGNRSCSASPLAAAKAPSIAPLNTGAPFAGASYFLQDVSPGMQRVYSSACSDGGTCAAPQTVSIIPQRADMNALRICSASRTGPATLFAWEEGTGSGVNVRYFAASPLDAGVQPAGQNPGHRPQPVYLGAGHAAVAFDTDTVSGSGLTADEIYLLRLCR